MNKKFKNYGLWVSLASGLLLVLQNLDLGIDIGKYNLVVNSVLGLLVTAGVISNPEKGKGYTDGQ
jgi:uncharacterized membrane protein